MAGTLTFDWQYEIPEQYPQGDYYVIAAINELLRTGRISDRPIG